MALTKDVTNTLNAAGKYGFEANCTYGNGTFMTGTEGPIPGRSSFAYFPVTANTGQPDTGKYTTQYDPVSPKTILPYCS